MNKPGILSLLAVLLLTPLLVLVQYSVTGAVENDSQNLEQRMKVLEETQTELYHTLAEKKAAGLSSKIADRITLSGLLEIELDADNIKFDGGDSTSSSDLVLATAQLGFGIMFTEEVRSNIILLYEEGSDGIEVDEAAIDIDYAPLFGRIGRIYIPFGVFNSHFINSPMTQELGETRETAMLIGYGHDLFSVSAYLFNGDAQKVGEESQLRDFGASLVLTPTEGLALGCSYLSDLADSDAELLSEYQNRVAGWSAFATYSRDAFGVSIEVLGATKVFSDADLDADGNGQGDQPLVWNLELSWAPQENLELAVRFEGSEEFAGFPERQYGIGLSWGYWESTTLSLEYLRGEYDSNFGRNEDDNLMETRDLVSALLAFEF